jgi:hypothetical protein
MCVAQIVVSGCRTLALAMAKTKAKAKGKAWHRSYTCTLRSITVIAHLHCECYILVGQDKGQSQCPRISGEEQGEEGGQCQEEASKERGV